ASVRNGASPGDEEGVIQLSGRRYEVIHSTRSEKGAQRWLMLMLRPFPTALAVSRPALRKRWSLTAREADVAASVIAGQTTTEMCDALSISRETLKTHIARLLDKANCENRSQLVAKYLFGD
ncbi:MAG TPA: helix-turn-helix transcriptional regulator, partial [Thermoanaerobaculia bacterium]|nr:helix-turn-helix transcriptional regulator [Thermoanaerobaculia bacterium]